MTNTYTAPSNNPLENYTKDPMKMDTYKSQVDLSKYK